ncbi:MAG: protein kinase [Isosphaeraceae bacterium]|nr:protein kinase [Isosphaeraceae bacterium]
MNESHGGNPFDGRTETLAGSGRDAFDEVAEDFAARCRGGEAPSISEYEARYPEHAGLIRKLLPTVAMMEQLKRDTRSETDRPLRSALPDRFGEFRVVRELGRGGMGVVYEAVQESLGRHVALKVIHHVQLDVKRLQRFEREARAIAHLHHTNIAPIYAIGEHEGLPYYAMQYIQGIGLDVLLTAWRRDGAPRGADRWALVARIGMQAAEALYYAHEQGVLHRDVKPANLLLDAYQSVWVTDFGLAKLAGQEDLTASGDVVGTLRYLAPEALRGETDERSDVYSLGLTLYELLTLSPPFGELSQSELLRRVSEGEPERPRRLDPGIPRDLETIVLKATAREPQHRYATARALAEDLKRFVDDRPIEARRATATERVWRWGRRNPGTAALAAGALVLTAVVGWIGYMSTMQALEQEKRLRGAAEIATKRAEDNVALSLKVFGKLFETLAGEDDLLPPSLGRPSNSGPRGPGDEFHLGHGHPAPPPGENSGPSSEHPNRRPPFPPGGEEGGPAHAFRDRPPLGREGGGPVFGWRPPGEPRRKNGQPMSQENVAFLESVLEFYDEFARNNATNLKLEGEAAWAYRKVGTLYDRLGRTEDAEKAYAHAIAMFDQLIERFPDSPEYRIKLVETYDMADPGSAEPSSLARVEGRLARATSLVDELVAESPNNLDYLSTQAHVWAKHGAILERMERPGEAEVCYRRAIALDAELVERSPGYDRPRLDRATTREALGLLLLGRDQHDEAAAQFSAAAEELEGLASLARVPPPLCRRLESLADAFDRLGDVDRSAAMRLLAADVAARHPPGPPGHGPKPPRPADSRP